MSSEKRRCAATDCITVLNSYTSGAFCSVHLKRAQELPSSAPSPQPAPLSAEVTAVLATARELLGRNDQTHGEIAAPFILNFLAPQWGGPFGDFARLYKDWTAREAAGNAAWVYTKPQLVRQARHWGLDISDSLPRFRDLVAAPDRLTIRSALMPDEAIRKAITNVLPGPPSTSFYGVIARLVDWHGLPSILLEMSGRLTVSAVLKWYYSGPWQRWQSSLWDGDADLKRRRVPTAGTLIRGWTLHCLDECTEHNQRARISAWNSIAPETLRREIGQGARMAGEDQASRDERRAAEAAKRMRGLMSR